MPKVSAPSVGTDAPFVTGAAVGSLTQELVLGTAVIMSGTAAARPAFATAGRLYFATDTSVLSRDTGTAWTTVGTPIHAGLTDAGGGTAHAHAALSGVTASQHHNRTEAKQGTAAAPSVVTWTTAFAAAPIVTAVSGDVAVPRFATVESRSTTGATARVYTDTGGAEAREVSFMAQEAT